MYRLLPREGGVPAEIYPEKFNTLLPYTIRHRRLLWLWLYRNTQIFENECIAQSSENNSWLFDSSPCVHTGRRHLAPTKKKKIVTFPPQWYEQTNRRVTTTCQQLQKQQPPPCHPSIVHHYDTLINPTILIVLTVLTILTILIFWHFDILAPFMTFWYFGYIWIFGIFRQLDIPCILIFRYFDHRTSNVLLYWTCRWWEVPWESTRRRSCRCRRHHILQGRTWSRWQQIQRK